MLESVSGILALCDPGAVTPTAAYCLDGVVLGLGDEATLAATALADHDTDGVLETNADEMAGLVGHEVALVVEGGTDPLVVRSVNGVGYALPVE
jgi:hypothetical protein